MTPWHVRETFDVLVIAKQLGALLFGVAAYYVAAGLVAQTFGMPKFESGPEASLINTIVLSLLMGFRNRAAYQRWWDARGLWGQLVNDSRNLAAKCAAFVPPEALTHSHVAEILVNFADALRRHLRGEELHLRNLPGFE